MARPRVLPEIAVLRRWIHDEGLTHEQVIQRVYEQTGTRPALSTVAVAMARAGLSEPRPRHIEEVPWVVNSRHSNWNAARMLRILGQVRRQIPITDEKRDALARWIDRMERDDLVVCYHPDHGFFYAKAGEPGDWPNGTPIRPGFTEPLDD